MIRYVPSPAAEELTVALWELARPAHLRTESDTSAMFGWVDDLHTPSKRWLLVDDEFQIRVHPEAVIGGIAAILQPYVDAGVLPSDTISVLAATIESLRGQMVIVYDLFPEFFRNASKSREEMVAAGRLLESILQAAAKR